MSIENSFTAAKYHSVNESLILSSKLYLKAVNSIDDDVRVSRRVYIPGSRLRGFESGKIGPVDSGDFVGGNYASVLNISSNLRKLFIIFIIVKKIV